MSGDSLREVGRITHAWDTALVSFTTTLNMPNIAVQPKHKALLLAAGFLLVIVILILKIKDYVKSISFSSSYSSSLLDMASHITSPSERIWASRIQLLPFIFGKTSGTPPRLFSSCITFTEI